jgi:two-component system, NarL family, response regulator LiaR
MVDRKSIRVMIVDDHPIVRDGMKNMLMVFDDLEFAGEADNGRTALACLRTNVPDVILMDIAMPEMGGIPAMRGILKQYPQVKVIMLTSYAEDELIQESLQAGALGFLLKNSSIETLASAIRTVYAGQPVLAPEVTKALIRLQTSPLKPGADLSQREQEVLALMVEGLSNEEIAERLVISPATARHHVSACIQKLGASNRAQASAMAVKLGLVS